MGMRNHKYNGAIDRMGITEEQAHVINGGQGLLFQNNLFNPIPKPFYGADYVVVDPPWNRGNLKSFYTKADMELDREFEEFLDRIFEIVAAIDAKACYMEMGFQSLETVKARMEKIFPNVRVIESKYYNRYKCYFIIGEKDGEHIDLEDKVKDELLVIEEIISKRDGKVLDFCLGRGAVSRYAHKHGKEFVGSELNINRLAVSLEDIKKAGGAIETIPKASVL